MKKIIHLSDLHIGYEDCGTRFRTIIDNIAFLKQPAANYIVVITGDIVDNATQPEQTDEAVASINELKKLGYTVLVVPGNHDYGTGTLGDPTYIDVFKEKFYNDVKVSYPRLDIIDELAFIGLDTMAEELHWIDRVFSEGELGNAQIERLKILLTNPEVNNRKKIIYMHHHPFDFKPGMQLKDRKELKKVIANRVDVLLFGHYHSHHLSAGKIFHGKWGIPRCYNAGSSTHKNGNTGFHRVIDLTYNDPRMDYDGNFL
jgi:predicted MPP superfamily phosphohydrolase